MKMMPGIGLGWEQLMNGGSPFQTTNGVTLGPSVTTLTNVSPVDYYIPAWTLQQGQVWRVTTFGIISTAASAPGTLTVQLCQGTISAGTLTGTSLASSGAFTLATSLANNVWTTEWWLRIHGSTPGTAVSSYTYGVITGAITGSSSTSALSNFAPATASSGGSVNLTTETTYPLILACTFGTSSASNQLTIYQMLIELLD